MSFRDFIGNQPLVNRLRAMLASEHFPQAVILAGPEGAGKYTLAQMLAKAMDCQAPVVIGGLPDFCGNCSNCRRIAQADDLSARFTEAVEAREALRDADRRETRIFVQTHPDVLVIPPDPPQMMIKVDQVRHVTESIYYRPAEVRRKIYIFTDSAFMKEAANALLKILEEPPEFAHIILLTTNPGELLVTIRSRSALFTLAPLATTDLEPLLRERRPELNEKQRRLVAALAGGAVGKARAFDLAAYIETRNHALALLNSNDDHTELFRVTETYRSGAEGKEKLEALIAVLYSLLEDLLALKSDAPELVRNTDITAELRKLAAEVTFEWITAASARLAELESGMRRNLLRSLSLDAFAVSLERS
jgi:DNA polymerase III subunit delta'